MNKCSIKLDEATRIGPLIFHEKINNNLNKIHHNHFVVAECTERMGNNITTRVIRMFDRSHMEIQSISGQIERAQSHGTHEKHEIYMNSVRLLDERRASADGRHKSESKQVCVIVCRLFFSGILFSPNRNIKNDVQKTEQKIHI